MPDNQSLIDEAWRRMPQATSTVSPGRFTRARFDRMAQVLFALGGTVLGAQALVISISARQFQAHPAAVVIVLGLLAIAIVCCAIGWAARAASGVFAAVFVLVLVLWCFVESEGNDPSAQPWPFYLLSIAVGATAVAFPLGWQIACAIAPPLLFGLAQGVDVGVAAALRRMLGYDVSMAILLNVLVIALGWMFRGIADGVDAARARVVEAYTRARVAEASERERVEMAGLMHDSVLAALIAAGRAETPRERALASDMSRDALMRLANAESDGLEGSDAERDVADIARAIERAARELGVDLAVAIDAGCPSRIVPGRVARAIALAAKQALANAVHHADAVGLAARIRVEDACMVVEVSDRGPGLDVDAIPADRLGIRASIMARLAAVGGVARVDSGSHGTTVTLLWRAPDDAEEGAS